MLSLPVKYRPKTFEDVCSQENIIKILKRQVEIKKFKNCYLFSGPSGTGKTTIARILAYKINEFTDLSGNLCSSEPIEIDAASNNGVDNIRTIVESASHRSLDGKYKVYIIDEAHMLTNQSWNALLKTIEETPEYTIFMFCTTEYHKIPKTIQNRCQQYFLSRVPLTTIVSRLKYICNEEHIKYTDEGLMHIAKLANGSVRQSIAYLESCVDYCDNIDINTALAVLGNFSYDIYFNLINFIIDKNQSGLISLIEDIYKDGNDLKLFVEMFIDFILDLSKYTIFKSFDIINIPTIYTDKLEYTVNVENATKYFNHILDKLMELKQMIKNDSNIKSTVEIFMLQL